MLICQYVNMVICYYTVYIYICAQHCTGSKCWLISTLSSVRGKEQCQYFTYQFQQPTCCLLRVPVGEYTHWITNLCRGPASSYRSGRVAEIPLTEAMIDLQLVADSLIIETFWVSLPELTMATAIRADLHKCWRRSNWDPLTVGIVKLCETYCDEKKGICNFLCKPWHWSDKPQAWRFTWIYIYMYTIWLLR